MNHLIGDALLFAVRAHDGQKRKYTFEPYIIHPISVAKIVSGVQHTDSMIAAALNHDVIEDCGRTKEEVERALGRETAELVEWLTDVSKKTDGNRARRKAIDAAHLAEAPAEAQTIKLADLIDNTESIVRYDPDFARVYLTEKRALLEVLKRGDSTLWNHAADILEKGRKEIGL